MSLSLTILWWPIWLDSAEWKWNPSVRPDLSFNTQTWYVHKFFEACRAGMCMSSSFELSRSICKDSELWDSMIYILMRAQERLQFNVLRVSLSRRPLQVKGITWNDFAVEFQCVKPSLNENEFEEKPTSVWPEYDCDHDLRRTVQGLPYDSDFDFEYWTSVCFWSEERAYLMKQISESSHSFWIGLTCILKSEATSYIWIEIWTWIWLWFKVQF